MARSFFWVCSSTKPALVKVLTRSSYMRVDKALSSSLNFATAAIVPSRSCRAILRPFDHRARKAEELFGLLLDKALRRRECAPGIFDFFAEEH